MDKYQAFMSDVVYQNPDFEKFVNDVSPKGKNEPKGFDWVLILSILWEIFKILKERGWFDWLFNRFKIKRAMRLPHEQRQAALENILGKL